MSLRRVDLPRTSRQARRGVVLLDAVLVLAIVALAAYVLMPVPTSGLSRSEMRAEAVRVAARFRDARNLAIQGGMPVDVTVDAASGRVEGPGAVIAIRQDVAVVWTTSDQCPLHRGRRALRFLADGRSCGGVLSMRGGGQEADLRVDWLTGRVEMALK